MRRRQLVAVCPIPLNNASEVAQATNGCSVTSCEKLEESSLLLIVHCFPDNFPQPLDNLQQQGACPPAPLQPNGVELQQNYTGIIVGG